MGRDAGRGDWQVLAAVLEEGLEALCILRGNQGRSQAAPIAAAGSRSGQGAATVRRHRVAAGCLGLLTILEKPLPIPAPPLSRRPYICKKILI